MGGMERRHHRLEARVVRLPGAAIALAVGAIVMAVTCGCAAEATPAHRSLPPRPRCQGMAVGADLYADHDYTVAAASRLGTRSLAWITGTLGLCAVQIDWELRSQGNTVSAGPDTATPAVVAALTGIARRDGLAVSYRVMFTGSVAPSDSAAWFASLLGAERPYLELAQASHVAEFIAGNEHTSIETNPCWQWFFAQSARLYHGTLSYATWGGRPGYAGVADGQLSQLPPVRDWGITAYPVVNLPATATQASVTQAWQHYLRHIPSPALHRMALDEIGIPAAAGAYEQPWDWTAFSGVADDTVQARWFTAACTAARELGMRGIWFFAVFLDDDPAHPYPGLAKFENRPASVAAIRACAHEPAS
jgi:hypothetical protein